jgi:hypothetical protein
MGIVNVDSIREGRRLSGFTKGIGINSQEVLLAWTGKNGNWIGLMCWQEPHSCRDRLWIEEVWTEMDRTKDFSKEKSMVWKRKKLTEDTYDFNKAYLQAKDFIK